MTDEAKWKRRLARERAARKQAEELLEEKSRELWEANEALRLLTSELQQKVEKRSVDLVQALEKEVGANKAKSEFVSMISHEMRTPLNAIIGFSEILASPERAKELEAQQVQNYTENIHTASRGLLSLINDILDMAKIEAGKLELEEIDFAHNALINQLFDTYKITARSKPVEVRLTLDDSIPSQLIGDPNRVSQIINNLFSNALKFTEKGYVELSAKLIKKGSSAVDVEYSVHDSGIGMSAEVLEKLFQPFTQADNSMSRKYGGTGLGLTISRQLVEAMGGKIWVESNEGKGSRFYVRVRYQPSQTSHSSIGKIASEAEVGQRLKSIRLLLVEDDPINQELAKYLIESEGADLSIADNGLEAVAAIENAEFDLVLMDLQMPVCDGYTATLKVRENRDFDALPIVAMTANAANDVRDRCLEVGMNDFLTKPFIIEDLLQMIEKYCQVRGDERPKPETVDQIAALLDDGEEAIDLIDVDKALAALHGNRHLYRRIIGQFKQCCDEGVYSLDSKRIQSNPRDTMRLVFNVKRLAETIGAYYIADLLEELEQAVQRDDREAIERIVDSYDTGIEYVAREIDQLDLLNRD
jgi:signal transduction histidine kinase/CheY-like chemotaxis protein